MVSAMRDTDWFAGTHRDQPALIMRWDLKGLLGELFGLDTGTHGGLTFDFHHPIIVLTVPASSTRSALWAA